MQVTVILLTVLASLAIAAPQQGGYDYSAPQAGGVTGAFSGTRQQQPTGSSGAGVRQQQGTATQVPGFTQSTNFPKDGSLDSFGTGIAQGPGEAVFIDSTSGGRESTERFQVSPGSGEVWYDNSQLTGTQVGRPLTAASGGFGATSSSLGSGTRGFEPTGSQPSAFSSGSGETSFGAFSGQGSGEIGVAGQQGQTSGQVAGVRGQTSGTRGQEAGFRGQGTRAQGQGAGIQGQRSGIQGQGDGTRGQGFGTQVHGAEIQGQAAGIFDQSSGFGEQGQFVGSGQSLDDGGFGTQGEVEFGPSGDQVSQAGQRFSGVSQGVFGQGPVVSGQGLQDEAFGGVQGTGAAARTAIGVRGGQATAPFVDDLAAPAEYNFKWDVTDPESGNFYGHEEERNGTNTRGRYYVTLPDTRVMTVEYFADETGYHPTITYEGEAQVFETVRQQGRGQQTDVAEQATQRAQQSQFQSQGSVAGFQGQAGDFEGQAQTGGFQGQTGSFQGQAQTGGFQGQAGDFQGQAQTGGLKGQTGDFQVSSGEFVGQEGTSGFKGQRQTGAGFQGQAQTGEFLGQGETGTEFQGQAQIGGFPVEGQTGDGFQGQTQTGEFHGQGLTSAVPGQGAVSGFRAQGAAGGLQGQGALSGVQSQGATGTLPGQGFGFGSGSQETGVGGFQEPQQVGPFQSSGEFIDLSAGFPSTGFSGEPFRPGSSAQIPSSGEITTFGSRAQSSSPVQPSPSSVRVPSLASVAASGYTAPVDRVSGRPSLTSNPTSTGTGAISTQNIGVPLPGLQSQTTLEGQQQFGLQPQQQFTGSGAPQQQFTGSGAPQQQFTGSGASQEQFVNLQPSVTQQQQPGLQTSQQSTDGLFTTQQQQPAIPTAQQQSSTLQTARQPQGQLPFGFQSNQQRPESQDRTVELPSQLYQAPNDQSRVNSLSQQAGIGPITQQQPNLFQQSQTLQSTGFSSEQTGSHFTPQQSRPLQQQQGVQNTASSAEQSGFTQQPNTFIQQQEILNIGSSIEQSGPRLTQPSSFQHQQGIQSIGSSSELSASQFVQQQPGPFPQQQTLQNVLSGGQSTEQEYQEPSVQDFGSQSFQRGQGQAIQNQQTGGNTGVQSGFPDTSGQRFQNQLGGGPGIQSASGEVGSAGTRIPQRPSQLYGTPQ